MIDVIVGLQWGSEGKGRFAAALALKERSHGTPYVAAVRAGGSNAGHTVHDPSGRAWVCRHLPSAFVDTQCGLFIGPGAAIDLTVLEAELRMAETYDPDIPDRLSIDGRAVVIREDHAIFERSQLGHMGSTCKGVGAAYAEKLLRRSDSKPLVCHLSESRLSVGPYQIEVCDVPDSLERFNRYGMNIMAEGTQGTWLSLDHGQWPWVTSKNVTAAAVLADCGLPPQVRHVYGVMRTYPIRVGGPSGPMGNEITWEELEARIGITVKRETTTVTGRQRRIADLDIDMLDRAARLNGVTRILVSFLDYLDPRVADSRPESVHDLMDKWPELCNRLATYAAAARAGVVGVTFGPDARHTLVEVA